MLTADIRRTAPKFDLSRFTFADARTAPLWALLRIYVGYEWLTAGLHKATDPNGVWIGEKAGAAVGGFLKGALAKTTGEHPDVQGWYASFIQNFALPNAQLFSYMVTFGEIAVGIALILGLFTGLAAFFGGLMNLNFMLAGAVSTNPVLFVLATWLVLAWRVSGYLGLDYFILPRLGLKGPNAKPRKPLQTA